MCYVMDFELPLKNHENIIYKFWTLINIYVFGNMYGIRYDLAIKAPTFDINYMAHACTSFSFAMCSYCLSPKFYYWFHGKQGI